MLFLLVLLTLLPVTTADTVEADSPAKPAEGISLSVLVLTLTLGFATVATFLCCMVPGGSGSAPRADSIVEGVSNFKPSIQKIV